jgi:putative phage-type endonuclease
MKIHKCKQRTSAWYMIRNGKITGTALKGIVGGIRARETAFYEILSGKLAPNTVPLDEDARFRGVRLEPVARELFEKEYNLKVYECGFLESTEIRGIGLSPDGIIKDKNGKYTIALEIKCPLPPHYVEYWYKNEIPKIYKEQIGQYFVVNSKLKTLYFVLYCPEVEVHPMHVIIVKRKDIKEQIEVYTSVQKEFMSEIEIAEKKLLNNT